MSVALTKTPLRQVSTVQELLFNEQARTQISMVASRTLTPERLMRVTANAIRRTPALQKCEPMSFLGAMMFLAQMSLEPNTPLGHAYLLPFNKSTKVGRNPQTGKDIWEKIPQVEVVIGYKGFKELARRSGQIKSMHGDIVYEGDLFSHEYGSGQHLKHIPCGAKDTAIGAYFHVAYNGGEGHIYMTKAEIEGHRDRYSKGWQNAVKDGKTADSPWKKDWEAMWIKTPCRILIGRGDIPMSTELADALAVDEATIDFRSFAADPTTLPDLIDGDTGEVDGESETTKDKPAPAVEKMRDVTEKAKPEPEKAKPRAEEKSKQAEKASEPEPDQSETAEAEAEPQPTADERLQASGYWKMVLKDLGDIGADGVLDLHGESIDRLKSNDPELHALVMEQINNA